MTRRVSLWIAAALSIAAAALMIGLTMAAPADVSQTHTNAAQGGIAAYLLPYIEQE